MAENDKFDIHKPSLMGYINRELGVLEKRYGFTPLLVETKNEDEAFDIGYYLAFKRIKERIERKKNA